MSVYSDIAAALLQSGLFARGGFHPAAEDLPPAGCRSVILIGNVDPELWAHFLAGRRSEPDALDRWTKRQVDDVARNSGGWGVYPSDGPPYFPFQRWAMKVEPVYPSPLGMLIHPEYGLWHAYRAAICLPERIEVPAVRSASNPCETCVEQPCLSTCPVDAFTQDDGYNVPSCAAHLRTVAGADCLAEGCRARRACPIAGPHLYADGQAAFHMEAFIKARNAAD